MRKRNTSIGSDAMEKRKKTNRKIIKFFMSIVFIFLFMLVFLGKSAENVNKDPLNIGKNGIKSLINKEVPHDKWSDWGYPETLEGTNNQYWIVYLEKANISFVSEKKSDKVLFAGFYKDSAIEYFDNLMKKRTKLLEKQFSKRDGSHTNLTKLLKNNLHNPDSYEHVETLYKDEGEYIIVQTRYRAKNVLGGKVLGKVKIKASLTGEILEILEQ